MKNSALFLLGFLMGAGISLVASSKVFPNTSQEYIDKFKEPVCVETVVGTDTIKRCYKLQEVK